MGNSFLLLNATRSEYITFLGYDKEGDIIRNKIPSQMVAYYLFEHNGDHIFYLGDQWQVGSAGTYANFEKVLRYSKDVTNEILKEMIDEKYFTEEDLDRFASWWRKSPTTETKK